MILTTNAAAILTATTITKEIKAYPKIVTGPSTVDSGVDAVYKLTEYKKPESSYTGDDLIAYKADKDNLRWVLWVDGGLMNNKLDFVIIEERTIIPEPDDDLYEKQIQYEFINLVNEQAYLEATIETVEENNQIINKLIIKFSKWLDGKKVYVEVFRNSPDHNTTKTYVKTTTVSASNPEILDVFWQDASQNKITSQGYNKTVDLLIYSLGLKFENINLTLFDFDTDIADSDAIDWETGVTTKTIQITDRYTHVEYIIPDITSPLYTSALADESPSGDQTLELFIKIASSNTNLVLENKYADLELTTGNSVKNAFIGELVTKTNPDRFIYNEFNQHYPGGIVKIIAECCNMDGEQVVFSLYEVDVNGVLVNAGEKLNVLQNDT